MTVDQVMAWSDPVFVRSLRRERPVPESARIEREQDAVRGPYVPHGGSVHHCASESRH